MQLGFTIGIIAIFTYNLEVKKWVRVHPQLWIISLVISVGCAIALSCCGNLRRQYPLNFILLGVFTLCESFVLGVVASRYNTEIVIMAAGITAAICLALTLFAFQTTLDFTACGGILLVSVIILLILGIVVLFFPGKTLMMIYASAGALIFSIYLIYDTQLMIGGEHKNSISPDEYVYAALSLYLDIVNIFMYILTILGLIDD